jgi:hypothetical protein
MTEVQKKIGMSKEEAISNAKFEVKEKVLTIKVALDVVGVTSRSGKSLVIASTHGNQSVAALDASWKLGLNFYKPSA